jgi:hypothetical protein
MAENKKDTIEKQEVSKPQAKCGCGCTLTVKK